MAETTSRSVQRVSFSELSDNGRRGRVSGRFEVAQTNNENRAAWAAADLLSARSSLSPAVRRITVSRARYERDNDSDLDGVVNTLVDYTIGPGPTLQMLTDDPSANSEIEDRWSEYWQAIDGVGKLSELEQGAIHDGESVMLFAWNPPEGSQIGFNPEVVECDLLAAPYDKLAKGLADPKHYDDGITYDDGNNPIAYDILDQHPGEGGWMTGIGATPWPASMVWHHYRRRRAGQRRGVVEYISALALYIEVRRFELAVLAAAETAADFAMGLEADVALAGANPQAGENFEVLELRRRMLTVFPPGYRLSQTRAEQPTTTFKEFRREILGKAMRCLGVPAALGFLDSSMVNMSAAYLVDMQSFGKVVQRRRLRLNRGLDRIVDRWLTEGLRIPGYFKFANGVDRFPRRWFWPLTHNHADPDKVASANETKLRSRQTTYAELFAESGQDYEKAFRQMAKEKALMKELGIEAAEITLPAQQSRDNPRGKETNAGVQN